MWNFIKWTSVVAGVVVCVMFFLKDAQTQTRDLDSPNPRFDSNRVFEIENAWQELIREAAQDVEMCETLIDEAQTTYDTACDLKKSVLEKQQEAILTRHESAELVEYLRDQKLKREPVFYDDVPEPLTDPQIEQEIDKYLRRQNAAEEIIKTCEQSLGDIQNIIIDVENSANVGSTLLENAKTELNYWRTLAYVYSDRLEMAQKEYIPKTYKEMEISLKRVKARFRTCMTRHSEYKTRCKTNAEKIAELKSKVDKSCSDFETTEAAELTPVVQRSYSI